MSKVARDETGAEMADGQLVAAVRAALAGAADPARAPAMRAYMKSEMLFRGVPKPVRERALRPVLAERTLPSQSSWRATVRALWREAEYREERYAAIDLTGHRAYRAYQRADTLDLYEEMITTGAWWDYVDEIASRRVGPLLAADPAAIRPVMLRWSRDGDLWRRRTSIICQLSFKAATDLDLLYACIDANLDDRDFFIRKAIGWALRRYAWTNPTEVRRFVTARGDALSPLSRREALKNIG
ncbi:3-methyladenine DNA glycosylase AlkD [Parafrankia irregularis]|uniref:3-methyladenine DNA glycosylase AlkD n=2 Tax=Frankiaceae TaxID=74712 RepID=A0A0S4QW63_9ACTN|nr:DNA alkylation repair protein [Parafrankia irregularis]CUU59904.1 3-methyladenine DNA glycosylase AlkD [Parafrankia irregularis]